MTTQDWIRERLDNCHKIAATKTGKDRASWLQDAIHLAATLEAFAALKSIEVGDGTYGAQAYEYKATARAAVRRLEMEK